MIESLSYKASDFFIRNNKIKLEDRDAFAYGLRRLILNGFMLITFSILGLITNRFIEIYIFLLFFIPLRKYAGGFHCNNPLTCYISSCLCVMSGVYMAKYINSIFILFILATISMICILLLSPVQDKHKKISQNEQKAYKRVIKRLFIINTIICIMIYNYGLFLPVKLCVSGIFIESLLVIFGVFKNLCDNKTINNPDFN